MSNFYVDTISKDPRFTSIYRIDDINLLEPVFRSKILSILQAAKSQGINLMIFETYRSRERQKVLFDRGATKLKEAGVHHFGLACDLVKNENGKPSWEGDFSQLGSLARTNGLIWGGDWGSPHIPNNFVDAAHVQRCAVYKQDGLFSLSWYPDANYNAVADHELFTSMSLSK